MAQFIDEGLNSIIEKKEEDEMEGRDDQNPWRKLACEWKIGSKRNTSMRRSSAIDITET